MLSKMVGDEGWDYQGNRVKVCSLGKLLIHSSTVWGFNEQNEQM